MRILAIFSFLLCFSQEKICVRWEVEPAEFRDPFFWFQQVVETDSLPKFIQTKIEDFVAERRTSGHPFSQINIVGKAIKNDTLTLKISIADGEFVRLVDMEFGVLNNEKWKHSAGFQPLEIFQQSRIDWIESELRNQPELEYSEDPILIQNRGRWRIRFPVRRLQSVQVSGTMGISTDAEIPISIRGNFPFWRGGGSHLRFFWDRKSVGFEKMQFSWQRPVLLNRRIGWAFEFSQDRRGEDFLRREYFLAASVSLKSSWIYQLRIGQMRLGKQENIFTGNLFEKRKIRDRDFSYSTRLLLVNHWSKENPVWQEIHFCLSPSFRKGNYQLNAKCGFDVISDWKDNLVFYGGNRHLRGYLDEKFSTNLLYFSSVEYGFSLFETDFFLFQDCVIANENERFVRHSSYGFGVGWHSIIGKIRLDYGIPQESHFLAGMVHVRYGDL